jgi:hypothetical protein
MIGATGCAGSDDKCICGQDFRFQTSFFKCIFDKCSIDLAADVFGTYSSGCNDAIGTADAPVSDVRHETLCRACIDDTIGEQD